MTNRHGNRNGEEGRSLKIFRILMGLFYILAGANHFWHSAIYVHIMPPFFPFPTALVYISGVFEMLFGVMLCFSQTRRWGAWGLIALLIAVFPANLYMAFKPQLFSAIPPLMLYFRLPIQGVLIYAAFLYTRAEPTKWVSFD